MLSILYNYILVFFHVQNIDEYGIDWQGPIPVDEIDTVKIPDTPCCLNGAQLASIQATSLVSASDDPYAVDLYSRVVSEVERLLELI